MNRQYLEEMLKSKRKAHDRYHIKEDIKASVVSLCVGVLFMLAVYGLLDIVRELIK